MADTAKRIALITGGSSGIGFEMAKQMVSQGSSVIICGRSEEKLQKAKQAVPKLVTIQCDVTDPAGRISLFERINNDYPHFNMLVNNAGIVRRFLLSNVSNLDQQISQEWQINYFAPVLMVDLFLPLLKQNKGTIVNVTSGLVYVPLSIEPNYCATKAALHSMTQSMRIQFSELGIQVVEIFYPAVDTPFQNGHKPEFAIQASQAAEIALKHLNKGKNEIRVKKAGILYKLSRIMPEKALEIMNRAIPQNIESILTRRETV